MAITKERKQEIVAQYQDWLERSRAVILTEYVGLTMKDLDELRRRIREAGGEYHIVKNTLSKIALETSGMSLVEGALEGSTAMGFAFEDAPALAKTLSEFAKASEFVKIKGGYLGKDWVSADDMIALAELPPLPVLRARLLGTIMAPPSQLARMITEPARQVVQALKVYADQQGNLEAA